MLKNFNAVTEKWIPVTTHRGIELASLLDVFSTTFGCVDLSDGAWGGLPYLNLLIAVAIDVCRPQSVSDIQVYLNNPEAFSNDVSKYLSKNKGRFDLFGKNPFLQVGCYDFKSLKTSKPEHIRDAEDTLVSEGSTTTELRDSPHSQMTCEARIVQSLLKSLVYGCNKKTLIPGNARPNLTDSSGKIVSTVVEGQPKVSPIRTTNSGSSGTLNIFVQCSDLIKTVILNMISEDVVKTIWPMGFGRPIYLQDTDDHTKMVSDHEKLDMSFLGHLVPLTKYLRILTDIEASSKKLDSSKIWVIYSHAVAYDFLGALENLKKSGSTDNNYYAELSNPKKKYTRGIIRPNSSLWKEFAGFNLKLLPKVISKFNLLKIGGNVTIHAVGMEGSGTSGLVYNEKLYESSITLDSKSLEDYVKGGSAFQLFQTAGKLASDISSKLFYAVISYAKDLYGEKCECDPYTEQASRYYWHSLDKRAIQFIDSALAGSTTAIKEWEEFCKETARNILRDIKDGSVRRNKAIAKALKIIS